MLIFGNELWIPVLVEVRATDPAGRDVKSDVSRPDVTGFDPVVDSDICFVLKACCFHSCSRWGATVTPTTGSVFASVISFLRIRTVLHAIADSADAGHWIERHALDAAKQ